jgi:hypothetical protein
MLVLQLDEKVSRCFTYLLIYTVGEVGDNVDGRPLRAIVGSKEPRLHNALGCRCGVQLRQDK